MSSELKTIRLQVLVDEKCNKMVKKGAHDSWMSVGQYMRDVVALMEGKSFDDIADVVNIGKEIGREGFEALSEVAERRGFTVREVCLALVKKRDQEGTDGGNTDVVEEKKVDSGQISLFD
jgi:hypothetical protein